MSMSEIKKSFEKKYPTLFSYLLMIQRGSCKSVCEWSQDKFVKGVMDCYKRHFGYEFDINKPVLFNEKLQWYKCFYQRDDFGYITDKVSFKEYIYNKLGEGYTVPMYGYWSNVSDLEKDWPSLPEKFVLKSNLASDARGVMIIEKKSELSFNKIKRYVKQWLKVQNTLLNSWDWRFYNSTPKVLAEKYMEDESGELRDYKFFCFDGDVPYFKVDYGRMDMHHANYYDLNLKELDMDLKTSPIDRNVKIKLPENVNEMFELASKLSKGFPFIRVDFFSCQGKLYLSELTFAPGGGVLPYPDWFNKELGERLILPKD